MTIVQFLNAMEKYSVEVLFLAVAVCLATSLIKKIIPSEFKKYLTFAPFLLGCTAYAVYLFFNFRQSEILSPQTVSKGLECGAAATIYYVMFEQFIRGKKSLADISDDKQIAVAGIIKNIITENCIYSVSLQITELLKDTTDNNLRINLCKSALTGKTLDGVTANDIDAAAVLISSTLNVIK